MADITRIDVQETSRKLAAGEALLVCAYDSDQKFAQYHLEGAISLGQLREKSGDLAMGQEIIFYCN